MSTDYTVAGAIAVALVAYLLYCLLHPEWL